MPGNDFYPLVVPTRLQLQLQRTKKEVEKYIGRRGGGNLGFYLLPFATLYTLRIYGNSFG